MILWPSNKILLSKGRGNQKRPGEFRETQNWIGGTRPGNAAFVPPPPELLMECIGVLEKFLHREHEDLPLLVKTALVHVQFETIHPFLDGNGRLGRLLITFLLCVAGAIREPILYLSLYFKMNRQKYYELLDRVRTHGDYRTGGFPPISHVRQASIRSWLKWSIGYSGWPVDSLGPQHMKPRKCASM